MPSFPLARAVRSSPRLRVLAIALLLAGLAATPMVASRADAHGNGPHIVTISGWVKIIVNNSPCVKKYIKTITLQRGQTEEKTIDINNTCDGTKATVRLTARLRNDRYVHTEGFIRIRVDSCLPLIPLCTHPTDSRPYLSDIPEDSTQDMPHTEKLEAGELGTEATAEFDFDIIVDGP
jgi:hypothetical protein